jgi:hypothetical protein
MYMTCSIYQMVTNGILYRNIFIHNYIILSGFKLHVLHNNILYQWVVCQYYHVCYHSWPYTYFPLGVRVVVVDSSNHIMFLRILDKLDIENNYCLVKACFIRHGAFYGSWACLKLVRTIKSVIPNSRTFTWSFDKQIVF